MVQREGRNKQIKDMTPKEKAQQLLYMYDFVFIQNYSSKHEVKQAAIIAIDQIISELQILHKPEYTTFIISQGITSDGYERVDYWEEVKTELDQL